MRTFAFAAACVGRADGTRFEPGALYAFVGSRRLVVVAGAVVGAFAADGALLEPDTPYTLEGSRRLVVVAGAVVGAFTDEVGRAGGALFAPGPVGAARRVDGDGARYDGARPYPELEGARPYPELFGAGLRLMEGVRDLADGARVALLP